MNMAIDAMIFLLLKEMCHLPLKNSWDILAKTYKFQV
jgi:hypothetical protein